MNVGTGHWIFALLFALVFVVALFIAYGSDKAKSPGYFSGSSKFLLFVTLFIMILLVVKMLTRLS